MKNLEINFESLTQEKIEEAIINKEKREFCIIYELLEHTKNKKETAEKKLKLKNDQFFFKNLQMPEKSNYVLKSLRNKFHNKIIKTNEDLWRIGILCKKDAYYILTEILKCLERNGYEWIISSSYKIKCQKIENDRKEQNLIVLIHIFSNNDFKDEYLVDLHKLNGNTMEFLDFSHNFISSIILSENSMIIFK